jgi:hypothetical protein
VTAQCGGGTSAPKAGLEAFVAVSAGAVSLALQRSGAEKLMFLIPLLQLPVYELAPFCAADPPALPTFTEDEVFSLLRVGLDADYFSGLAKARDLISRILWFDFCECTSGTLTPFVEPTLPTNTPQPVAPEPSINTPCQTTSFSSSVIAGGAQVTNNTPSISGLAASAIRMTYDTQPRTAAMGCVHALYWVNGAGTETFMAQNPIQITTPPGPQIIDFIVPVGAVSFRIKDTFAGNAGTTYTSTETIDVFCGQLPGGTATPCCPPDTSTQSYLDLILKMVTLVQRQAAPFSYIYGPDHPALTGSGAFAVSGLVGCSVDVTTLPDSYGRATGSPEQLFDIGFVTLGTADGYERSRRIDADGTLFLPPLGGAYTVVGYTLSPGVEVSIRELVREP